MPIRSLQNKDYKILVQGPNSLSSLNTQIYVSIDASTLFNLVPQKAFSFLTMSSNNLSKKKKKKPEACYFFIPFSDPTGDPWHHKMILSAVYFCWQTAEIPQYWPGLLRDTRNANGFSLPAIIPAGLLIVRTPRHFTKYQVTSRRTAWKNIPPLG